MYERTEQGQGTVRIVNWLKTREGEVGKGVVWGLKREGKRGGEGRGGEGRGDEMKIERGVRGRERRR